MKYTNWKTIKINEPNEKETIEFKTLEELKEELKNETDEKKREKIEDQIAERRKILDIGESCVDDSHFIPMSELVKRNMSTMALGNDQIKGMYDFEDGKDTGANVPKSRRSRNIAELSKEVRDLKAEVKKSTSELSKSINDAKDML